MNGLAAIRRLLAVLALLLGGLLLLLLLHATDTAFAVWERLRQGPEWFLLGYLSLVALLLAGVGSVAWRLLRPHAPPGSPPAGEAASLDLPDERAVTERIARNEALGVEAEAARRELADLHSRRGTGEFHIALLGEINAGKSTLVKALLPEAEAASGPVGGVTRAIHRYQWRTPAGDRLVITDLPGLNEVGGGLDALAREEALRAHVALFLCEGDLTRDQFRELETLAALQKPLIVVVNKSDRFSEAEVGAIQARLRQRLGELPAPASHAPVVAIVSGGWREVVRLEGSREVLERRPIPPQVAPLTQALQRRIDQDPELLESLRDGAVFQLAVNKLDQALQAHRRERTEAIINDHARKAVVAAVAAVTPGLDVVIQGVLGYGMVKALCALYEVPVTKLELEGLLKAGAKRGGRTMPLLLAVAGNVLKAFPGVGTVAGGLAHAVAYGLIFDALGRAVAHTLESRGELALHPTLERLEVAMGEALEARGRRYVTMAMEALKGNPPTHGAHAAPADSARRNSDAARGEKQ